MRERREGERRNARMASVSADLILVKRSNSSGESSGSLSSGRSFF